MFGKNKNSRQVDKSLLEQFYIELKLLSIGGGDYFFITGALLLNIAKMYLRPT
jgi:hypothetical protein